MKPLPELREEAAKLIEEAQAKAEADFQKWVTEYLPKLLKHLTEADRREVLRKRYRKIQDWFFENPDYHLDAAPGIVLGWVTAMLHDLQDGYRIKYGNPLHLRGLLADRLKAKLCLQHIDSMLMEKAVPAQEPTTKIYALYYWYLWQAGLKPELHSGSGKKAALGALAQEHGISGQKLYQIFNAVGRNSELNPKKQHILEVVIPMLADHPEALAMAQKDIQELQKRTKE